MSNFSLASMSESNVSGKPKGPDEKAAIHAMAVLAVHNSLKEAGRKVTIRAIAEKDSYWKTHNQSLSFYYILAFGAHGIPVLARYLIEECGWTKDNIQASTSKIISELISAIT